MFCSLLILQNSSAKSNIIIRVNPNSQVKHFLQFMVTEGQSTLNDYDWEGLDWNGIECSYF
jgi:hypothetical protein